MLKMIGRARDRRLRREVDRLTTELEAKDRIIRIRDVEIENLAGVIARDRARVQAETAELARRAAEAEGNGQTK
jgi:hypothetical protein